MMSEDAKKEFYRQTAWTRYVIAFLGVWLLAVVLSFNYSSSLFWWSDLLAGGALLASGIYALTGHDDLFPWDSCGIGLWLLVAPVLFWSPDPFVYLNDTTIGVLALAFGALIPGVPEDALREGEKAPPEWSYNPSSWMQRLPVIALAVGGWLFSVYMASFQLGYRSDANFLFGKGSTVVLETGLSGVWPMADAGFAAVIFLLVAVLACLGSARRWHSMPWIVVLFGGVTILLGLSNALYTLMQPLMLGYWCGWCLLASLCALGVIVLAVDEVVAVSVYLLNVRETGKPFWQVFWQGDGGSGKERKDFSCQGEAESFSVEEMFRGIAITWLQGACLAIGGLILLTAHTLRLAAANEAVIHVLGALILVVSVLTLAEILRALRYLTVLLSVVLIVYAWVASDLSISLSLFYTLCALALVGASLWKKQVHERYGKADKLII